MLKTEEYLVETADRCIRLAREGRKLVKRLETISNELMAKAVEIDTTRDKNEKSHWRARASARVLDATLHGFESKSPAVEPGFLHFSRCRRARPRP